MWFKIYFSLIMLLYAMGIGYELAKDGEQKKASNYSFLDSLVRLAIFLPMFYAAYQFIFSK